MQSVSSRIWTPVTVSISYDDNHYTTGTSGVYITWSKQFQSWKGTGAVGSLMIHGVVTRCALFPFVCDLKAVQRRVIQELMLYEFELGHNATEATKKRFVLKKLKVRLISVQ